MSSSNSVVPLTVSRLPPAALPPVPWDPRLPTEAEPTGPLTNLPPPLTLPTDPTVSSLHSPSSTTAAPGPSPALVTPQRGL